MRNMFFTASMNRFMPVSRESSLSATAKRPTLSYNLERTTRLGNLFFCRRAEGLRVNRQLGRQLQVRERERAARLLRGGRRFVVTAFVGPSRAAGSLLRHRFTPPLPRGAVPCGSCRVFPAYPGARPPDAFSASRGRGWFAAY